MSTQDSKQHLVDEPQTGGWKGTALRLLGMALIAYVVITLLLGWYWSLEPDRFPVRKQAQAAAEQAQQPMPNGYVTAATLRHLALTLLEKPGGYISNDVTPPGVLMDNMPNWEFGVLVQIRDMSRALRKDIARSQSQSSEDPDLAKGEPLFNFDNKSWALPASESEYRRGIKFLDSYIDRLANSKASFYSRADNLNAWLSDVTTRLGSLSQRLSASIGRVELPADEDESASAEAANAAEQMVETPWMEIDDVFYQTRGHAWALSHLLRAVAVDFEEVLAKKNATASLKQVIRELDAAQDTLWSPFVLNGSGYGMLANHSLVMANFISRANAGIIDLRNLLSQG